MCLSLDGPVLLGCGIGNFGKTIRKSVDADEMSLFLSLTNIGGYIPLIGIISGIAHIMLGEIIVHEPDASPDERTSGRVFIIRGLLEILGVGGVLAPIDIGCSIARLVREHLNKKPSPSLLPYPS